MQIELNRQGAFSQTRSFENTAIVLCRAEHGGNVGASCRAMESMGFSRLLLVDCPAYDNDEVRTLALKSFHLYEAAKRYDSLEAALADFPYAAGFTRRQGARRRTLVPVQHWTQHRFGHIARSCALVFGNEQTGLSEAELACCDENVYIPTAESQPSLNLAQAVQLVCWECRRQALELASENKGTTGTSGSASHGYILERINTYFDQLEPHSIFGKGNRAATGELLRSLLCRSGCTKKEADRLFDFLENSAEQIAANEKKRP